MSVLVSTKNLVDTMFAWGQGRFKMPRLDAYQPAAARRTRKSQDLENQRVRWQALCGPVQAFGLLYSRSGRSEPALFLALAVLVAERATGSGLCEA